MFFSMGGGGGGDVLCLTRHPSAFWERYECTKHIL